MARNGSGTYSLPAGNPVVTGTTISSTDHNNTLSDIATALTASLAKDGQTTPTANLPMGTYRHTGVGAGAALTDYARYDQLQNSAPQYLTTVSGADTITAAAPVTPAAYAAGQTFRFIATSANTGAVTLNVSSLGAKSVTKNGSTALAAGDIPSGAIAEVVYDGTRFQLLNPNPVVFDKAIQDFRLTLTSGTPVTTADVTAAGTIYAAPYKGNRIALYDGSAWNIRTSAEFSLALSALTSGKPYDVFCYDNAGTPTLEFLVWTNDTTRATALAYQDGVLVKSGATTRRYLGTFYTTSSTQTEDSAANRYLYNYYHRAVRKMLRRETTATWTYNTASIRQANNSASNQLNFLQGVAEDAVRATLAASFESTTGGNSLYVGIGFDSTSATSTDAVTGIMQIATGGRRYAATAHFSSVPAAGRHYIAWLEQGGGGTDTFYGAAGITGMAQGLVGEVMA